MFNGMVTSHEHLKCWNDVGKVNCVCRKSTVGTLIFQNTQAFLNNDSHSKRHEHRHLSVYNFVLCNISVTNLIALT